MESIDFQSSRVDSFDSIDFKIRITSRIPLNELLHKATRNSLICGQLAVCRSDIHCTIEIFNPVQLM